MCEQRTLCKAALSLAAAVLVSAACVALLGACIPTKAFAATSDSQIMAGTAIQTQASQIRQTDVSSARSGCVLLGVDGTFDSAGKSAVLNRINAIRQEACSKGVPDPRDESRKLTLSDYVPIKWSSDLEVIAQTRAAEGSICEDHARPNETVWSDAHANGNVRTSGENLAWNNSGMMDGIDQWYEEMSDWVNQNAYAVTGHYTSLINPNHTYVALGEFTPDGGGWTCVAGEFLNELYYGGSFPIDETEVGVKGAYRQVVEVASNSVSGLVVSGQAKLKGVATKTYSASVLAKLTSVFGGTKDVNLSPLDVISWSSSAPSVVSVDSAGKATSKSCGTARLVAQAGGMSAAKTVKVVPKGTKLKKVSPKKKALKVTWAKQSSLTQGFEVRCSTKKSMKGAKTIKVNGASKTSCKIKKLKPKKKYYVQVRAFAKVGGEFYYSDWSSKKAKKTK